MNSLDSTTSSFSTTWAGSIRNLSSSKHPSILFGSPEATAKLLPIMQTHTKRSTLKCCSNCRPSSHCFADASKTGLWSTARQQTLWLSVVFLWLISLLGRSHAAWDIPDGMRTVPDALSLPRQIALDLRSSCRLASWCRRSGCLNPHGSNNAMTQTYSHYSLTKKQVNSIWTYSYPQITKSREVLP